MYSVYWIRRKNYTDVLNEGYVGVSNDIEYRFSQHRSNNSRVGNAIRKYDDVVIDVIYCFENLKEALQKEKELRPKKYIGWNIAIGGQIPPSIKDQTPIHEKISKTVKKMGMNPYSEKTHDIKTVAKRVKSYKANKQKWIHNPQTGEMTSIKTAYQSKPDGWNWGKRPKYIPKTRGIDYNCNVKNWKVIEPNGNIHMVSNLKIWCKERDLKYSTIVGSYKGWKTIKQ